MRWIGSGQAGAPYPLAPYPLAPYPLVCALVAGLLAVPLFGAAGPAQAQSAEPPPFPEFTFRRVTPPAPGQTGPRINIQIAPPAVSPPAVSLPALPDPGAARQAAGWFWDVIPPDIAAGRGRFAAAMMHLDTAPQTAGLGIARLEDLRALARTHGTEILRATVGKPVSPALVLAVIAVESAGQPRAVSRAGAEGLMQLIPATAARFGVTDSFDPAQNIAGGVAYLEWLMGEFDRDPLLVLAAYNAGEGAVRRAGGVPDFPETRAYVPKVLATWALARLLCLTPPELVSDGCVFESLRAG